MKDIAKIVYVFFFISFSINGYNQSIIADHTVVNKFEDIPQQYIDSVKRMWVQVLGESHSAG
ncbi:MAG: hypothetical protein JXB49_04525, partial [Bacteroidales bacterium]|nr:hypothetical protein [Bacteroidales bacterium]